MKKKGLIVVLLVVALLTLTGCMTKKALTTAEVKAIVEEQGFRVTDANDKYSDSDFTTDVIEIGNNNFYIQFITINNEENAKALFNSNKEKIDGFREGSYTNSSMSGKNYETYELVSGGYYMYISRVDNTIIYVNILR